MANAFILLFIKEGVMMFFLIANRFGLMQR